jgi:riboflavin kinase/FMN adenylyltransferase
VRVRGIERDVLPGVASLGVRPTVDGIEPLLEVHLFDFDGDLYGRRIDVEFVAKLRDEAKFADLEAMVRQIDRDAADARAILADAPMFGSSGEGRGSFSLTGERQNGFRLSPE